MQQCYFCGRWFTGKQAVRAHLKYCTAYLDQKGLTVGATPISIPKSIRRNAPAKKGTLPKPKLDIDKISQNKVSKKESGTLPKTKLDIDKIRRKNVSKKESA